MKKEYFDESIGLWYELREDGCYYPLISAEETPERPLGKYGRLRKRYLGQKRPIIHNDLVCRGKLYADLYRVDEEAGAMVQQLIQQMAARDGTDEALKATDQMKWVGMMNNYKACAEEIVLREMICV